MLTCSCTLPASNPNACKSCSRWIEYQKSLEGISGGTGNWYPSIPWESQPETKKIKRITRTIEKYSPDGKLLGKEVITEEVEDIEKKVWISGPTYIPGSGTINIGGGSSTISGTNGKITTHYYDPDISYLYRPNLSNCSN